MSASQNIEQEQYEMLVTSHFCSTHSDLPDSGFRISAYGAERMPRQELLAAAASTDVIVSTLCEHIDEELLAAAPRLKMVANTAVGYDNIDVSACTKRGVLVSNTPGVLDDTTADLTFALILACGRRLGESERYLRDGRWDGFRLNLLLGQDIHRKTLGLIGFGRIGQRVAARARGFNMKVLYWRRHRLSPEQEQEMCVSYATKEEIFVNSDFVSLHCPLSDETQGLVGESQLAMMKRTAYLINTSRGAVVQEEALVAALENKLIAGAGLDVFLHEPQVPEALCKMENVCLLPHIGSATIETRTALSSTAVETVKMAFAGEKPENLVNPEAWDSFLALRYSGNV